MLWMMLSETVVPVRISLVPIVFPLTAALFGGPYSTLSPAPPSPANRSPVSVMSLDALNDTFASGWVSAPHGQVPAGVENVHMPWLVAPVMCRLLCTSENPAVDEGAFQVA